MAKSLWVPVRTNAFNRNRDQRWSIARARDVIGSKHEPTSRKEAAAAARSLNSQKRAAK